VNEKTHNIVAIEVKGGTDVSNAHNRAGEAEKSHTKAKGKGFRDFWTIISKKGLDGQTQGGVPNHNLVVRCRRSLGPNRRGLE